jgi:hypothetical protein
MATKARQPSQQTPPSSQQCRAARSLAAKPMRPREGHDSVVRKAGALPGALHLKRSARAAKSGRILRRACFLPTPAASVLAGRNQETQRDKSNGKTRAIAAARTRSRLHDHGHRVRLDRFGR